MTAVAFRRGQKLDLNPAQWFIECVTPAQTQLNKLGCHASHQVVKVQPFGNITIITIIAP